MLAHLEVGQRSLQKDLWAGASLSLGVCWICRDLHVLPLAALSAGSPGEASQRCCPPEDILATPSGSPPPSSSLLSSSWASLTMGVRAEALPELPPLLLRAQVRGEVTGCVLPGALVACSALGRRYSGWKERGVPSADLTEGSGTSKAPRVVSHYQTRWFRFVRISK